MEAGEYDKEAHFSFLGYMDASVALDSVTKGGIPDHWILLDNQLNVDVFSNPKLLSNICQVSSCIKIWTQAGEPMTTFMGNLDNYGPVWYCENGIANILSLQNEHQEEMQDHI